MRRPAERAATVSTPPQTPSTSGNDSVLHATVAPDLTLHAAPTPPGSLEGFKHLLQQQQQGSGATPRMHPGEVHALVQGLACAWAASPQGLLESSLLGDVMPGVNALVADSLAAMEADELAATAVLLAQLRYCDASLLQRLAEAVRPQLGAVPGPRLAALLSALADHNARPSPGFLGSLMLELQGRLGQLPGGSLVQLLWGLVRLGVRPTSAWLASFVKAKGLKGWTDVPACELATLSRAFGEISFQPRPEWTSRYLSAVQHLLPSFRPHELSDLAWGLSRMRVMPTEEWGLHFLKATELQMHALRTSDLVTLAAAVAELNLRPDKAWLSRLMAQSALMMPRFGPRELAELLPAVVQLHEQAAVQAVHAVPAVQAARAAQPGMTETSQVAAGVGRGEDVRTAAATSAAQALEATVAAGSEVLELLAAGPGPSFAAAAAAVPRRRRRTAPLAMQRPLALHAAGSLPPAEETLPLLDPAWVALLLDSSRPKLSRFTAQALPALLRGLARAGARPDSAWLTAFTDLAGSKADVLTSHDLCALFVTLGLDLDHVPRDPAHRAALAAQLAASSAELLSVGGDGELLLDVLMLLCRLEATLPSLFGGSPSGEQQQQQHHHHHQAQCHQRAHRWRQGVLASTLAQVPRLSAEQLGALMVAAVKLELAPPVSWVQACVSEIHRRLAQQQPPSLPSNDISTTLSALSDAPSRLHFTPQTLVPVVWAMATLGDSMRACRKDEVRAILSHAQHMAGGAAPVGRTARVGTATAAVAALTTQRTPVLAH